MSLRASRLLVAACCAFGLTVDGPVQAQGLAKCADIYRQTIEAYAKTKPYLKVTKAANKAWEAFVKAPDDDRLDAVLESLADTAAGILIPGYGQVQKGGKLVIDGVNYTIKEAKDAQLNAILCGGNGGYDGVLAEGFFQLNGAQTIASGINCENYADKITTLDGFAKLKDLYKGYYTGLVQSLGSRQNYDDYQKILDADWNIVERTWKAKVGANIYEALRADLMREAKAAAAQDVCDADPAVVADGTTDKVPLPKPGSGHFELVETELQPSSVSPDWKINVAPENITLEAPFGHSECTWTTLPPQVDQAGFDLTIATSATAAKGNRMSGYIVAKSGFGPVDGPVDVETHSENGTTAADSVTLHIRPQSFESLGVGDTISILVGGCDVGNVVYKYAFHK